MKSAALIERRLGERRLPVKRGTWEWCWGA